MGFECDHCALDDYEVDLHAGFLTVAIAELLPSPVGSVSQIREIVEWSDKISDPNYQGHALHQMASLFPRVRVFDLKIADKQSTWNTIFRICIDECEFSGSWIEGRLAQALRSMSDLDQNSIPYRVLCRSIFDGDRSSFFLALYRCLEGLYAYSGAQELSLALGLKHSWADIATALEERLGWHPREEGSLSSVLRFASKNDLECILKTLTNAPLPETEEVLAIRAGRSIYALRNSIVHFRPAQHNIVLESYDWSTICEAMVGIILDVYYHVFASSTAT